MTLAELLEHIVPGLSIASILGLVANYVNSNKRFAVLETMSKVNEGVLKERRALADAHEAKISALQLESNQLRLEVMTAIAELKQVHVTDHAELKVLLSGMRGRQSSSGSDAIHNSQ